MLDIPGQSGFLFMADSTLGLLVKHVNTKSRITLWMIPRECIKHTVHCIVLYFLQKMNHMILYIIKEVP